MSYLERNVSERKVNEQYLEKNGQRIAAAIEAGGGTTRYKITRAVSRDAHIANKIKRVQDAIYREPGRWRPSPYHLNEAALAGRYGVAPAVFRAWTDFPDPISDFGGYDPPREQWWHLPVIAAWERTRSRALPIGAAKEVVEHDRILPQQAHPQDGGQSPPELRPAKRPIRVERLTKGRELELINRAKDGDRDALDEIIVSVQPLIAVIAGPLSRNSGIPLKELVSAVNVQGGMAAAIQQFDPEKGFRFSTFAKRQIKWALSDYLRRSRRSVETISLDAPLSSDSDDIRTLEDVVADDSYDDEASEYDEEWRNDAREKLNRMLVPLNDRERLIVESRHGLNGRAARSLREIGADLRLSAERVRQIEAAAFLKAGLPADIRS